MNEAMLEPDALKGARPVLRGAGDSDASPPPTARVRHAGANCAGYADARLSAARCCIPSTLTMPIISAATDG